MCEWFICKTNFVFVCVTHGIKRRHWPSILVSDSAYVWLHIDVDDGDSCMHTFPWRTLSISHNLLSRSDPQPSTHEPLKYLFIRTNHTSLRVYADVLWSHRIFCIARCGARVNSIINYNPLWPPPTAKITNSTMYEGENFVYNWVLCSSKYDATWMPASGIL